MPDLERKSVSTRVEIKNEDKGEVDLVFSTFNVVDKDGDVTLPGAFSDVDGKSVPVSDYQHTSWEGRLPVGVAKIKQMRNEARASARFFLDTQHGSDAFKTVKALHDEGIGDWSYGYKALDYSFGDYEGQHVRFLKKLGVDEVSPVLVGAGVNTRTLSAKAAKGGEGGSGGTAKGGRSMGWSGAFGPHETDVIDEPWMPDDVLKALGLSADIPTLRKSFALQDTNADPAHTAAYAFLHHDADGRANVRAAMLGIATLNGAKGAHVADDATRQAVYDHLASHLRDADLPVPDLRSGDGQLKMNDEAIVVLADLSRFVSYAAEVGASRRLRGKGFTRSTETILGWIEDELKRIRSLYDDPNAGLGDIALDRIRQRLLIGE